MIYFLGTKEESIEAIDTKKRIDSNKTMPTLTKTDTKIVHAQ